MLLLPRMTFSVFAVLGLSSSCFVFSHSRGMTAVFQLDTAVDEETKDIMHPLAMCPPQLLFFAWPCLDVVLFVFYSLVTFTLLPSPPQCPLYLNANWLMQ